MDIASFVLQIIILGFLIWYASETYKLRKEAAHQRIITIQPIIDFIYDPEDTPNVLTLENVGPGVALNLQLYIWSSKLSTMTALPEDNRPSIIKHNFRIELDTLKVIDTSAVINIHPELDKIFSIMTRRPGINDVAAIYEDTVGNTYYSMQCSATHPFTFGRL